MAENMDTTILGFTIPAASITALNPLMVSENVIRSLTPDPQVNDFTQDLFLIPFFAKAVYPLFDCIGVSEKISNSNKHQDFNLNCILKETTQTIAKNGNRIIIYCGSIDCCIFGAILVNI
jgi:hypothetical protein